MQQEMSFTQSGHPPTQEPTNSIGSPGSEKKTIPNTEQRPHTSASAITTYLDRCGEYYLQRYINKKRFPPLPFMLKGSAVHTGQELNFKQKIQSHADLSPSKVKEATAAAFDERIAKEGYMLTSKDETVGASKILGLAKDSAVRLADLFIAKIAPLHQPILVEQTQRIRLDEKTDIMVKMDMVNDRKEIQDSKTSKATMNIKTVQESFQFKLYGLAYRAIYKEDPAAVVIDNMVDLKRGPKHTAFRLPMGQRQYQTAVDKINLFLYGTKTGVFMPAQKGSWFCNEDHCGWARECKYYQFYKRGGGKTQLPPWMRFGKKKKTEVKP